MATVDLKGGENSYSPNQRGTMFTPRFDRFFRTHEKVMWQFSSIDFNAIQPELLTPGIVEAVRGAMLVESHNPVYTMRILEYYRPDHEMTSFTTTWSYEELKHYLVLRTYLEALPSRFITGKDLPTELDETRAGPWGDREMGFTRVQSFTYAMLQEEITGLAYKRLFEATKEPVLKEISRLIGRDEYRHCQYYLEKGQEELKEDSDRMKEVDETLIGFEFPGPTFVKDYKRYSQVFRGVNKLDFAAVKEVAGKVSQLTGKKHLLELALSREGRRTLSDQWGITPMSIIRAMYSWDKS